MTLISRFLRINLFQLLGHNTDIKWRKAGACSWHAMLMFTDSHSFTYNLSVWRFHGMGVTGVVELKCCLEAGYHMLVYLKQIQQIHLLQLKIIQSEYILWKAYIFVYSIKHNLMWRWSILTLSHLLIIRHKIMLQICSEMNSILSWWGLNHHLLCVCAWEGNDAAVVCCNLLV